MIIDLNTATGTVSLWSQERIILRGTGQGFTPDLYIWTNLHGSLASPLAHYSAIGSTVEADVTDYVRAYPNLSKIYYIDDLDPSGTPNEIAVSVVGLTNPMRDFIPFNCEALSEDEQAQTQGDPSGLLIVPPCKILQGVLGFNIVAEMRVKSGNYSAYPSATFANNALTIPPLLGQFGIFDDDAQARVMQYYTTPLDDERDYIMLRWVSRYGVTKTHVFERRDITYTTAGAVALANLENAYDVRKGWELGFKARLDGLTAYDFWYYSDIVTSSKVEAMRIESGLRGTWSQVEISTKEAQIPNCSAGEFKDFEISVKYKKYDTV